MRKPPPARDRYDQTSMRDGAAWLLGEPVRLRKLVDWTELGLVPAPRKERRNDRTRGTQATWSQAGYLLWLNLLASQEDTGADIASLANAPVGLWIYTDTDWIELPQVRRALITWRSRRTSYRAGQLVSSSAELVRRIRHPDAPVWACRRLHEMLATPNWDRTYSRVRLERAVAAVIVPNEAHRMEDPLRQLAADHVSRVLLERFTGLTVLPQHPYDDRGDGLLAEARGLVQAETAHHAVDARSRDLDRWLQSFDEPLGADERIQVACLDLVTMLGRARLREMGVIRG